MGIGDYGVEVIVDRIILMVCGVVVLFFWVCAYGLAKDRARRGGLLGRATAFSLSFILGMTLFTALLCPLFYVLIVWLVDSLVGEANGDLIDVYANALSGIWELLVKDWKLGVGLFGMLMSALLGAYFGVKQYHEVDKDYVEPE